MPQSSQNSIISKQLRQQVQQYFFKQCTNPQPNHIYIKLDKILNKSNALRTNDKYSKSLMQISRLIFIIAYPSFELLNKPIFDENKLAELIDNNEYYDNNNLVEFIAQYQLCKRILWQISIPQSIRIAFQSIKFIQWFYVRSLIIYRRIQQKQKSIEFLIFSEFMKQFYHILHQRIKIILNIFGLQMYSNLEYIIHKFCFQSLQKSNYQINNFYQNYIYLYEQIISIDQIILCFVYLWFKINKKNVIFGFICTHYQIYINNLLPFKINKIQLDRNYLLCFYNNIYVSSLTAIQIDEIKSSMNYNNQGPNIFGNKIEDNNNTILDNLLQKFD